MSLTCHPVHYMRLLLRRDQRMRGTASTELFDLCCSLTPDIYFFNLASSDYIYWLSIWCKSRPG